MATHHYHTGYVDAEVPIPGIEVKRRDVAQRATDANFPRDKRLARGTKVRFWV